MICKKFNKPNEYEHKEYKTLKYNNNTNTFTTENDSQSIHSNNSSIIDDNSLSKYSDSSIAEDIKTMHNILKDNNDNKYTSCLNNNSVYQSGNELYQIHTLIKITFDDLIFRVKQINIKNEISIMNYYSIIALVFKNTNNTITNHYEKILHFYLNKNNLNYYDHLLSMNLSVGAINIFVHEIGAFIYKHRLSNIKLPPIIVNKNENECDINIDDKLNQNLNENFKNISYSSSIYAKNKLLSNLNNTLIKIPFLCFVDFAFILPIDNISSIYLSIKQIVSKLTFIYEPKKNFILRFYLFETNKLNLYRNIDSCKIQFKKAISTFPNRAYSYVFMYIFKEEIIKCDLSLNVNPYIKGELIDNELLKIEDEYQYEQQTEEWLNRNNPSYKNNNNDIIDNEQQERKKFVPVVMSSSILRISTNTNFAFGALLRIVNCSTNGKLRKLNKKTILSVIVKFLSVGIWEEMLEPKYSKKIVYKKLYDSQIENIIPMLKRGKTVHSDSVHCKYDEVYNILAKK